MAFTRSLLLLFAVACAPDGPSDTPTDHTDVAEVTPCDDYTWDTVGHPFMLSWCTGCHGSGVPEGQRAGAPPEVNLDTLQAVQSLAERVAARATGEAPSMPPGGGPSDVEIEDLEMWLSCAAE